MRLMILHTLHIVHRWSVARNSTTSKPDPNNVDPLTVADFQIASCRPTSLARPGTLCSTRIAKNTVDKLPKTQVGQFLF